MENQKLFNLDSDLPEHDPKTLSPVTNDGISSDEIKENYENDPIPIPEKVIATEKLLPLENTFEVIEQQESTVLHKNEDIEVTKIPKDDEKEDLLESDTVSSKIEDLAVPIKTESPRESPKEEELVVSEKLESKIDNLKAVINQENECMIQSEIKIADTPEVVPKVSTKKDTDEDVCDIKIGPEELFCRIGLGKIIKYYNLKCIIYN